MKSRTLKAICAAVSAVAVLATAMTGFAATTTTYNAANNKVEVKATLTADAGKEVTYLVKSGEAIVYIDQGTAVAANEGDTKGTVTFEYKIDKVKYGNLLSTSISYGTDGATPVEDDDSLGIAALPTAPSGAYYTITYPEGVVNAAPGEKVAATIAATAGYEIIGITIDGNPVDVGNTQMVTIGSKIEVETKKQELEPSITEAPDPDVNNAGYTDENSVTYGTYQRVIKVSGSPKEFGLEWEGYEFYAMDSTTDGYGAVKLIFPKDVNAEGQTVKAYWKDAAGGKYYYNE